MNSQSLPAIERLTLTEIGIPFVTDFRDNNQLSDRECLRLFQQMPLLENHSVKVQKLAGKLSFQPKSRFTLPFGTFEILTCFGDTSVFGAVYKIAKVDDPEKRIYILKAQAVKPHQSIGVLKELAIQHILYETSKTGTAHEDSPYAPKVFRVMKIQPINAPEIFLLSIQEFLTGGSLFQYCIRHKLHLYQMQPQSSDTLFPVLIKLARKLQNLWRLYKFNHCDLHAGNIVLHGSNVYLIDFGFSVLNRGDFYINARHHAQKEGRDISHLLTYLNSNNVLDSTKTLVRNILGTVYANAQQVNSENPHFEIQRMFDESDFDNPNAFPETILSTYNQGPDQINDQLNPLEIRNIQRSMENEYERAFPENAQIPIGLLVGALGMGALAAIHYGRTWGGKMKRTRKQKRHPYQSRRTRYKNGFKHRNIRRVLSQKRRITAL